MWELWTGLALAVAVSSGYLSSPWLPPLPSMGISVQVYYILPFYISHTTIKILFLSSQLGRKKVSCDCNFKEPEFILFPGCLPIHCLGEVNPDAA